MSLQQNKRPIDSTHTFQHQCSHCKKVTECFSYCCKSNAIFRQVTKSICQNNICKFKKLERFGCALCGDVFVNCSYLRDHLNTKHRKESLKCCDKNFDNVCMVHDHINICHNTLPVTSISKKKVLEKVDKPVKLGAPKGYQAIITNDNNYMECGSDGTSWEPVDIHEEMPIEWKMSKEKHELNLHNINPFEILENVEVTTSNQNPYRVTDPSNKYFPFANETEWHCFTMLKVYNFTKEQYNVVARVLSSNNLPVLSYDQINYRLKDFKIQSPIQDEKEKSFTYYGIENCIRYMFADPFIAKRINDGKKSENSPPSFDFEPYASKGFQKLASSCNENETPIVILPYLDEYRKGTDKTAGMYFSLLNFDRNFLCSNMESISLLGNSKTNIGQFSMAKAFMEELNELSGKSFTVYNAHTDSEQTVRILIGPWVWDSVQRWFSLYLESYTCSRCKCPKSEYCKCPDNIEKQIEYDKRTVEEAQNIISKLKNGEEQDGYKYVSVEDIEIRDKKIDAQSKAKMSRENLKKSNTTQLSNPYYGIEKYDILAKSIVDIMHGEGQGDLRKHLNVIFDFFHYTNILGDFQAIMDKYKTCQGKSLKMLAKDYKDCSFDEFMEFIVYSIPIVYEFLIENEIHYEVSYILRKKHVVCWANHVTYVLSLIQDNVGQENIEHAKLKYFNYRKQAIALYGEETFTNPNFHWNSHIFEDCNEWGNARFFWALLFELKHKQFKQFNDASNHKNLEKRGAHHEKLQRQIKINYPWIREIDLVARKWVPVVQSGDALLFKFKNGSLGIGFFKEKNSNKIIFERVCNVLDDLHEVTGFKTLIDTQITNGKVSINKIIGRCSIYSINNVKMINQYSFFMNYHKIKFE